MPPATPNRTRGGGMRGSVTVALRPEENRIDDFDSVACQADDLARMVRDQSYPSQADGRQHLGTETELTKPGLGRFETQARRLVGFLDACDDATDVLGIAADDVEKHATARRVDLAKRGPEATTGVFPQTEHVSQDVGSLRPHEHRSRNATIGEVTLAERLIVLGSIDRRTKHP